jgi:hypothetical protein
MELVLQLLLLVIEILYANEIKNPLKFYQPFVVSGLYPLQQAVTMFYLKSSEDIIQQTSKLEVICLISRTQIENKNIEASMKEDLDQE